MVHGYKWLLVMCKCQIVFFRCVINDSTPKVDLQQSGAGKPGLGTHSNGLLRVNKESINGLFMTRKSGQALI